MTEPNAATRAAAAHALECYKGKRRLIAAIERLDPLADVKLIEALADSVPHRLSRSEKWRAEKKTKARQR